MGPFAHPPPPPALRPFPSPFPTVRRRTPNLKWARTTVRVRGVASLSEARAVFLLVLIAGGGLLSAFPVASAQATPALLCLDRDARVGGPEGACVTERPPDYQQGGTVGIAIESAIGTPTWVSVRCTQGCPAEDPSATNVYWAMQRSSDGLRFPADFVDPGPQDNGGNALLDRAMRYNSTWQVTAHTAAPVSRLFHVWLYEASVDANYTIRPGGSYYLRATGFDPGVEVSYQWERKDPLTGRYDLMAALRGRTLATGPQAGWFEDYFEFPRAEARHIVECGDRFACYRIVLEGAGKSREIVNVQVAIADIVRSLDTTPRMPPNEGLVLQRSQNATFEIDLYYPGGRVRHGAKLLPDDVPDSITFGGKALRVAVEKTYSVNNSVFLVTEVPLRYDASAFLWRATWTIPRDLAEMDSTQYRLRLLEQRDVHGNRIPIDVLGNFTVEAARIAPQIREFWTELRRTELGTLRLDILYHNGSPVSRADVANESPFSGCFVRLPDPPPEGAPPQPTVNNCVGRDRVWGRYYEGAWNFTVKYPRGYEDLTRHRFLLENGSTDKYGNAIHRLTTPVYNVVPASPDVQFTTVQRGADAEVLERGNRVFVSATITYHDGSPYNHLVRVDPNSTNATLLRGTLIRRGPASGGAAYGPIASEEPFELTESDPQAGRWTGYLQLTDDDTFTPVGNWTFRFDIEDNLSVPNRNLTRFDREVVSTLIRLCPTFQPSQNIPTGATVRFRFKLYYSECDTGREVPVGAIESRIQARVYRYSPLNNSAQGAPLSNAIIPSYARESTDDWGLEYVVPNTLYSGTYLLVFTAADSYGNRLVPNSFSKPFSTFTEVVERSVITDPPAEVRRGDSATVVFDAREGDVGVDPRRDVRIQLERFDTSTQECPTAAAERGCWVRERMDVRMTDPTLEDHVGVFPVAIDTPVGLYRFSLQGRDSIYRIITAVSSNFTVNPTEVTRALIDTPPEQIVKGTPFTFHVENRPGDKIRDRLVYLNGRPFSMPLPVLTIESSQLNVTWSIPFEAPVGNYTLRLLGRDVSGNVISIIMPPIEATAAALEGRLLGQPTRVIERGDEARILFGVAYPDGGFYAAADAPRVYVHDAVGTVVDEAVVRREGLTFSAFWRPDGDTPIGEYVFEVSPQATGGTGNNFPPLRSSLFRVVPGTIVRNPIDDLGAELERTVDAVYTVPFAPDDRFAGFELVYYGPRMTTQIDTTTPLAEFTRSPLPHTLDAAASKYVARFDTDQQTQVGTYRIAMTGEDGQGNAITSMSRQFVVRPTTIVASARNIPPASDFGEGKTIEFSFVIAYRAGSIMDETMGRPTAVVLWNNQPVTQRPDLTFVGGVWTVTWTAPDILPPGEYTFSLGGADIQGNPLTTYRSTPYNILEPPLPESFMKVIPGPSPLLLALALGALGVVVAKRRRAS